MKIENHGHNYKYSQFKGVLMYTRQLLHFPQKFYLKSHILFQGSRKRLDSVTANFTQH